VWHGSLLLSSSVLILILAPPYRDEQRAGATFSSVAWTGSGNKLRATGRMAVLWKKEGGATGAGGSLPKAAASSLLSPRGVDPPQLLYAGKRRLWRPIIAVCALGR